MYLMACDLRQNNVLISITRGTPSLRPRGYEQIFLDQKYQRSGRSVFPWRPDMPLDLAIYAVVLAVINYPFVLGVDWYVRTHPVKPVYKLDEPAGQRAREVRNSWMTTPVHSVCFVTFIGSGALLTGPESIGLAIERSCSRSSGRRSGITSRMSRCTRRRCISFIANTIGPT